MIKVLKSIYSKLKKIFNKGYEHYLMIYLIINVIWIFLGTIFYNYFKFSYQNFSTSYVLLLILNIIVIILLNILKKIKFEKIDILLILLTAFGIIATIFAKSVSISLYGYWMRFEGLLQLLYYYSLLYLSSCILKDKNKNIVINFILIFGLINSIICLIQVFDILKFIPINNRGIVHGKGLISHFNFYGSYMVLCMGLSLGKFIYENKSYKTWINLFLFLIFYSSMLVCNTLSATVGLMFIYLFIMIYFTYLLIKKKICKYDIIRYIALIVFSTIISICMVNSNKTVLNKDIKKLSFQTSEIAKGNFDDSYGTSRMFAWKQTLKVVPKHLLHGVGIDNFVNAFDKHTIYIEHETKIEYFDKAHNEYLQKLITEGMFSIITYLGMLFLIFINSLKKIFKNKNYIIISLFLAFIGYCIQAFFNISVIEVAPLFWIVCGLLYDRKTKK